MCWGAWCVAWSGGGLTLQQRSVPESCSLHSCLGNKDRLLCGCYTLKQSAKNVHRHARTHIYKKKDWNYHTKLQWHMNVPAQANTDCWLKNIWTDSGRFLSFYCRLQLHTRIQCIKALWIESLVKSSPVMFSLSRCMFTNLDFTSRYSLFANRWQTCYKKTGTHHKGLISFTPASHIPIQILLPCFTTPLSTGFLLCSLFQHLKL